jgi:hypothetical protein
VDILTGSIPFIRRGLGCILALFTVLQLAPAVVRAQATATGMIVGRVTNGATGPRGKPREAGCVREFSVTIACRLRQIFPKPGLRR